MQRTQEKHDCKPECYAKPAEQAEQQRQRSHYHQPPIINLKENTIMSNINLPSDTPTTSLPSGVRSDPGGHGATRIVVRDGVVTEEHLTPLQYRPSQVSNGLNGILATGIGFGGVRIRSEADIKDATRFTINGIETDAVGAARMGFLTKNGTNSYSLPERGEERVPPADAPADDGIESILSEEAAQALDEITSGTGSPRATNALSGPVLAHLAAGNMDAAVASVVRNAHMDPSRAAQIIEGMAADLRSRAAGHLSARYAVDGNDVVAYLDTLKPELRAHYGQRIFLGDKSVYPEVVAKYNHAKRIAATMATPGWNSPR